MNRITARLAILCAVSLVSVAGVAAASPATARSNDDGSVAVSASFAAGLADLQVAAPGPFARADARVHMIRKPNGSTTFVPLVSGVAEDAAGQTFGAHLHTGPCLAGDPAAAGPHYNQSVVDGAVPTIVNDQTEVWLDFTVTMGGQGHAVSTVPFTPTPGDRSIVIHAEPTNGLGTAGPRLACIPLSW